MSRAWPFEDSAEGGRRPGRVQTVAEFIAGSPGAVHAVVIRIGLNDAQLLLVDHDGYWDRWVFGSVDRAREVAEDFGLDVHEGEFPETLRVLMNGRRRPAEEFDAAAYPEQGKIGPVIPYPENRPRQLDRRPDSKSSGSP